MQILGKFLHEKLREQTHVGDAVTKRRDVNWNHGQPEEEILAELFLLDLLLQIPIRRCHKAGVDSNGLQPADPFEGLLFDDSQHFRLDGYVQLADFIEKDCALIGKLELSGFAVECPGVGAFFVSEQLILDECVRDRSAVHGHERFIATGTELVNGTRENFFAGAALAGQQDRRVGWRHALNRLADRLHCRAVADDLRDAVSALRFFL